MNEQQIKEFIRSVLKEKGITINQLFDLITEQAGADELKGVSKRILYYWMKGNVRMPLHGYILICRALDILYEPELIEVD